MEKQSYTISENGFHGILYMPDEDKFTGKVLIVFSGSDGIFELSCKVADMFARRGLTVMATAYFNMPGLPAGFNGIPVEYIGNIAVHLKEHGYDHVGLWGISMGAELALLAGSYLPELIDCVIAASPICFATQGLLKKGGCKFYDCSAFSWDGKDIPYMKYHGTGIRPGKMIMEFIKNRETSLRFVYDPLMAEISDEAVIPVENMKGPVLMFSGKMDSTWPAYESGEILMERLRKNNFKYPFEHIVFEHGSHFLMPLKFKIDIIYKAERKYKKESRDIKEEIFKKTISFLEENWNH